MNGTIKSYLWNSIIWICVLLWIFTAVWFAVKEHEYTGLYAMAYLAVIFALAFIAAKQTQGYLKLMKSIPGDHKLIATHTSVVDVGNFRFIYNIYVKGNLMNPFSKPYLSMTVKIPFPVDDLSGKASVSQDLRDLISSLKEEGMLTYCGRLDYGSETGVTQLGQTLSLEFLLKSVTSPWLIDLQLKVLDIIDKHGLQELTYCTICGLASGSEYRLNKGNMFISSVHGGIYGDQPRRFSYIDTSIMYLREYESYFSVDSYHNLYDSAIPYESWLSIDVMEKVVKRMFKGTKTRGTIFIKKEKNSIHVNIRIASKKAANSYYLVHSTGYWWIYAEGALENINPISTEDDTFACQLLYSFLNKYTDDNSQAVALN